MSINMGLLHLLTVFNFNFFFHLLAIIGLYVSLIYLYDNLKSVLLLSNKILQPFFQPEARRTLCEKYGSWAVITGATDGIGKQYANELASQGLSIVLIARNKSKLIKVSNEIECSYNVKTKWIQADFSIGKNIYAHIEKELQGIQVGILVNNVGRMYDCPDELTNISENLIWEIINVNIASCTLMSRMLARQMLKNGRGAIVNISSGSELQPLPYMAVYSASKIYIKNLTLALQEELSPYSITVQLVTPMYVVTKMNEYASSVMRGGFLIPDAKTYAKSAVFTLGKTYETTGYWTHGLQYAAMKLVPCWIRTKIGKEMNKKFRNEYFSKSHNINTVNS